MKGPNGLMVDEDGIPLENKKKPKINIKYYYRRGNNRRRNEKLIELLKRKQKENQK